jgi:hypothetical protein
MERISFSLNIKTRDVIMFCLVRVTAELRGRWKVIADSGGTLNSKENPKIVIEKPHFIFNESHVKITRMESETVSA